MKQAADLFSALLAPRAREAYFDGLLRLQSEPWNARALALSAERRVRRTLGLSDQDSIRSFPSRPEALRHLAKELATRCERDGLPHVGFRSDCPADLLLALEPWLAQGLVLRGAERSSSLTKRTGVWCIGWGDRLTGLLQPLPNCCDCSLVVDVTPSLNQIAWNPLFWSEEGAAVGVALLSLEPLMGPCAPTLLVVRDSRVGMSRTITGQEGPGLLGCALAFEEIAGEVEGWGFESARHRAAWEQRMRAAGAEVCQESGERLPGVSAVRFPGRSAVYLHGLLAHRGVWSVALNGEEPGLLGTDTVEGLGGAYHRESATLQVAATASKWAALREVPEELFSALKRSEKLAEGLEAWPLVCAEADPHAHHPRIQQKAFRTLYCGQLKPEYATEGLRLVSGVARARGIEGLIALLVDEEDGVIVDAAFQAFGPPFWVAAGETLCELLIRKTHGEAAAVAAQLVEEQITQGEWELLPIARRWINLWIESLEKALQGCIDIEIETLVPMTPITLEGLEPGDPYPGWDQMIQEEKIALLEFVLDQQVRPYIALDAGGIQLLALEDLTVKIAYSGSCTSCPSSIGSTLQAIQQTLRARVHPEIIVKPVLEMAASASSV